MPLARADSYRKIAPWLQQALAERLSAKQKEALTAKLLAHFPLAREDQKSASLFLAIHYLKADDIEKIFQHWGKLAAAFEKKALALELFEKSLAGGKAGGCEAWPAPFASFQAGGGPSKKEAAGRAGGGGAAFPAARSRPLTRFMAYCCQLLKSGAPAGRLKPPSVLKSSPLAGDFVFLSRVQSRTAYLERGISRLEDRTSKMIMALKRSVSRHQKRKWSSKALAERAAGLLQKQIGLFESELGRLAASSPHGEKYTELKKIVTQWK